MNAFRFTTFLGYLLPYAGFALCANVAVFQQAANDRSTSVASSRLMLCSDLALVCCCCLIIGIIVWSHGKTSNVLNRWFFRSLACFVVMPLFTLYTVTNSFESGLYTQGISTDESRSLQVWLDGTPDLIYCWWTRCGGLPPSATDAELQAAERQFDADHSRLECGLPITATDAELKVAERKLAATQIRREFGLPPSATDMELKVAEQKFSTDQRKKAAEETRKIFGLPPTATAAQLLAVERKTSE